MREGTGKQRCRVSARVGVGSPSRCPAPTHLTTASGIRPCCLCSNICWDRHCVSTACLQCLGILCSSLCHKSATERTGSCSTARRALALLQITHFVAERQWCSSVSQHSTAQRACRCPCGVLAIAVPYRCHVCAEFADLDDCDEGSHCFSIVPESLEEKKALPYRTDPISGRTVIDQPFTDRMCVGGTDATAFV